MTRSCNADELRALLERLVGQKAVLDTAIPEAALSVWSPENRVAAEGGGAKSDRTKKGLGISQLNELLLLLGFDRVTRAFFQFLIDGSTEYKAGSAIQTFEDFEAGVDRFRKLGLLLFGNVKFAFKTLSQDQEALEDHLARLRPIPEDDFKLRHEPIQQLENISPELTYYLGYIIEGELRDRLKSNPTDAVAREEEDKRKDIVKKGKRNHEAYLASDHLDVYVATSMRQRHEFLAVSRIGKAIFENSELKDLKLRWFDPTQAYCSDRIDKGLSEALMLRRAKCTIYLAQETETLGKDSELASTLAQGKPVIAFVPEVDSDFAARLLTELKGAYPDTSERELLLSQFQLSSPAAAWLDRSVRDWINDPESMSVETATARLQTAIKENYDRRAETLRKSHPLAVQVNLETGVANGVLVVRKEEECARLVKAIITRTLEFRVTEEENGSILLREAISGSVFRVLTGDAMLMNAFWNFYLEPSE